MDEGGVLNVSGGTSKNPVSVGTRDQAPWYGNPPAVDPDSVTSIVFDNPSGIVLPKNSSSLFAGLSNLTEIKGIGDVQAGGVTDMSDMFNGASSLTSLDLSGWGTSNVIGMKGMFAGATSLSWHGRSILDEDPGSASRLLKEQALDIVPKEGSVSEERLLSILGLRFHPRRLHEARVCQALNSPRLDDHKCYHRAWTSKSLSGLHGVLTSKWRTEGALWCQLFARLNALGCLSAPLPAPSGVPKQR